MPLQGTFDVLSFSEILRLLSRLGVTGRLHLRSRSYGANLFFEDGALVGADQSEHQAAAAGGDVRNRLEEICFEMMEADRGSFEFQPGKPTALPGAVRLKVETVLARARKRLEEWRVLLERVPSLEVQPRLVADLDAAEVTLDKQRWRLLTVVDGRRNLRTIGRTLNLSDFDVCRILVDLLDAGVVELDGAAAALAASGRDLVPTIPLPEGISDNLVEQGPAGPDDIDDVRVAKVESGDPPGPPRAARRPGPTATKPSGSGVTVPVIPPPSPPGPVGGSRSEPGGSEPTNGASTVPTEEQRPARKKRRARRRTPGGEAPAGPSEPDSPAGAAAGSGDPPGDQDAKRTRRVIRIRSRQPHADDPAT